MNMRQVLSQLSEPRFGEDETDFFLRQMRELRDGCISAPDLREACRIRYKQLEVTGLIDKIAFGDDKAARDRALVLLLKEVFCL